MSDEPISIYGEQPKDHVAYPAKEKQSAVPDERVTVFMVAASIANVVVSLASAIWPDFMDKLPPGFEGQLSILIGGLFAYFKKRTPGVTPK